MFNHGLTASALFAGGGDAGTAGAGGAATGVLRRTAAVAPVYCGLMGISLFASLGLPGLNGFVGELLIFKGVFGSAPWVAAAALIGLLATAVFLLSAMQRLFHGPLETGGIAFADLTMRERWLLGVPVALMFLFGRVFPTSSCGSTNPTVLEIVGRTLTLNRRC